MNKRYVKIPFWDGEDWFKYAESSLRISAEVWRLKRKHKEQDIVKKPCCKAYGDVRGMCFTCIGNFSTMDVETLLRVRACPHTPYAIAWWFYNNFWDEFSEYNYSMLLTDKYIRLITEDKMMPQIYKELCELHGN